MRYTPSPAGSVMSVAAQPGSQSPGQPNSFWRSPTSVTEAGDAVAGPPATSRTAAASAAIASAAIFPLTLISPLPFSVRVHAERNDGRDRRAPVEAARDCDDADLLVALERRRIEEAAVRRRRVDVEAPPRGRAGAPDGKRDADGRRAGDRRCRGPETAEVVGLDGELRLRSRLRRDRRICGKQDRPRRGPPDGQDARCVAT